jgi:predicted amidophosphoribosyltransferase
VCGRPLVGTGHCANRMCRRRDRGFSVVHAVSRLDGDLRRALSRYKYRSDRALAPVFAAMVASAIQGHPAWFEEFDLLCAVPAYCGPGARRDWDPVRSILEAAAERLGDWVVDADLLLKRAETPALTGRSRAGRLQVARGPLRRALAVRPGRQVGGRRVLVFDDVLTEGATLHEAARLLLRCGAEEVAGLVLARA